MFAAPANLLAFLPKFYFGGLTAWIGQDILKASPLQCVLTCPAKHVLLQLRLAAWVVWDFLQCKPMGLAPFPIAIELPCRHIDPKGIATRNWSFS